MVRARAVAVGTGRAAGQYTAAWVLGGAQGAERGGAGVPGAWGLRGQRGTGGKVQHIYPRADGGPRLLRNTNCTTIWAALDSSRQAQAQIPEIYDTALEHYGENRFSAAMGGWRSYRIMKTTKTLLFMWKRVGAHCLSENYYKMTCGESKCIGDARMERPVY